MKIDFMPKNRLGKWSVGFGIAFVVLMALSLLVAVAIKGDITATVGNPLFPILSVALSLAGLLSFFAGIFTIIKYKEWSICKYLAVLYILAALFFLAGEFLFPH